MSMRVRYLVVFAACLGTTFFLPIDFPDLFSRFLFAGVMAGVTWLVQPTEGDKTKDD